MADEIKCQHCGERRAPLGFAPFPNELGQRIATEICQVCWREWLQKQVQVINHFGVDVSSPDGQEFLFANMKGYLFGEAQPQTVEIDTSKEGTVKW
jgi:Fe-S cluster biosynthesis and repair protein YggX